MFEKFTDHAQKAILIARKQADDTNTFPIGTRHLLLALVQVEDGKTSHALRTFGLTFDSVAAIIPQLDEQSEKSPNDNAFSADMLEVFRLSKLEAHLLGHMHVSTEHLLLGLIRHENGSASKIMQILNVHVGELENALNERIYASSAIAQCLPMSRPNSQMIRGQRTFRSLVASDGTRLRDDLGSALRRLLARWRRSMSFR